MTEKKIMKEKILNIFNEVYAKENINSETPTLNDDTVLLKTGLDSLGFSILIMTLEDKLGFDPFTISEEPFYPKTFGDLVNYYIDNEPK